MEEVCEGFNVASSHAPTQLVHLSQTQQFGAIHNKRIHRGNIEPVFDDGRCQKDFEDSHAERVHHLFQPFFRELTVGHADCRFGDDFLEPFFHQMQILNPVVQEVNLTAAPQLFEDGIAYQVFVVFPHISLHGLALRGRSAQ